MVHLREYFETAQERFRIRASKLTGRPQPWTEDPVFQQFRFCNVHREHDKTTEWYRENIRTPLAQADHLQRLIDSTIAFRWFNRIETGEKILDLLLHGWDTEEARKRLKDVRPVVTGAYMIKTPDGLNKLDGVLMLIEWARHEIASVNWTGWKSLQQATEELAAFRGLGPFLAYEIVSDLRHTPILNQATDIRTWANAGPGCARGLSRLYDKDDPWKFNRHRHQAEMLGVMRVILDYSTRPDYWPFVDHPWEMREVEHWACEYDKWVRGHRNEHLKRRYACLL